MKLHPDRCPECGEEPFGTVELVLAEIQQVEEDGSFQHTGDTNLDWQTSIHNQRGEVLLSCSSGHVWFARTSELPESTGQLTAAVAVAVAVALIGMGVKE